MYEKKTLIRRVRVVTEYAVVGTSTSSEPSYWPNDFKEKSRLVIGKSEETELEPLREASQLELALYGG